MAASKREPRNKTHCIIILIIIIIISSQHFASTAHILIFSRKKKRRRKSPHAENSCAPVSSGAVPLLVICYILVTTMRQKICISTNFNGAFLRGVHEFIIGLPTLPTDKITQRNEQTLYTFFFVYTFNGSSGNHFFMYDILAFHQKDGGHDSRLVLGSNKQKCSFAFRNHNNMFARLRASHV